MKKEKVTVVDLEKKLLQEDAKILPADITDKLCCIYDCIDDARYKIKTQNEEIFVCSKHSEELRAYTKSNMTAKFFIEKPYNTLRMKIDDFDIYVNEVEDIDLSELEKELIEKGISKGDDKIDRAVIESSVASFENITYAEVINNKLYYISCLPPNDLYFPTSSELKIIKQNIIEGNFKLTEKPEDSFAIKSAYEEFLDDEEFWDNDFEGPQKVFSGKCSVNSCNLTASYKVGDNLFCRKHLMQVQNRLIRKFFIDAFIGVLFDVTPYDMKFLNFNGKDLRLEVYDLESLREIHGFIKDYKMKFINFNQEFVDRYIRCPEIAYSAIIGNLIMTYTGIINKDFLTTDEWDEIVKRIKEKNILAED